MPLNKNISKLQELISLPLPFDEKKRIYSEINKEVFLISLEHIEQYNYIKYCSMEKHFVKEIDTYCPISRMALAKSSIEYVFEMMDIIWEKYLNDQQELHKIAEENDYTLDVCAGYLEIDLKYEIMQLTSLFRHFAHNHDRIYENDGSISLRLINNLHTIIKKIMFYYLSDGLTDNFLRDWGNIQEIIFPFDEKYRDHLIHQFYVFLLGCSILSKLQRRIIENWLLLDARPIEEIKRRTFRSWMLASMFHDTGYIAKKLKEIEEYVCSEFFSKNLNGVKLDTFSMKFHFKDKSLSEYLTLMDKVYKENEQSFYRDKSKKNISPRIKTAMAELDHGVLSSYLFWTSIQHDIDKITRRPIMATKKHIELGVRGITGKKPIAKDMMLILKELQKAHEIDDIEHQKVTEEIEEDADIAAYAIAIHNLSDWSTINFAIHPLAFLLVLCDELQQWGRKSEKNRKICMDENEYMSCNVFLGKDDCTELLKQLDTVKNLDDFYKKSIDIDKTCSTSTNFIEYLLPDVIVVQYSNIGDQFLSDFKDKLSKLFTDRLRNGPSLIATNLNCHREEIFFVAKNNRSQHEYKIII